MYLSNENKFLGLSRIKLDLLTPQDLGDCSGKRPRNRATEYGFRPRELEVGRDGLNYCHVCDYSIKTKVLSLRPHSLFGKPRDQQLECVKEKRLQSTLRSFEQYLGKRTSINDVRRFVTFHPPKSDFCRFQPMPRFYDF